MNGSPVTEIPSHIALRRRYGDWNAGRTELPAPVFFESQRGRWVIASYAAARTVLQQHGNNAAQEEAVCPFAARGEESLSQARALLRKNLFLQMSPDLERLRRVVLQHIGARAVAHLQPVLETCARELLARALAAGAPCIDVAESIAHPFVSRSVFDLIGVPQAHRRVIANLADGARNVFELQLTEVETRITYLAFVALCRRFEWLLFGDEPLNTPLANGIVDAVRTGAWSREEAIAQLAGLAIAARTSPLSAINSLIYQLATHPDVWTALHSGSLTPRSIIEEALRLGPPAPIAPKTLLRETRFDEVTLPAGERVLLLVGRVNRDPAVFADPDRFDPWRPPKMNFAFGAGSHKCPGQALAYLQLGAVLTAFLENFPSLELAEPPEWGEFLQGDRPIARLLIRAPSTRAPS